MTVTGYGPTVVGIGPAMSHGPGPPTITGRGPLMPASVGFGCQVLNGRRRGCTGVSVEDISDGRRVAHTES